MLPGVSTGRRRFNVQASDKRTRARSEGDGTVNVIPDDEAGLLHPVLPEGADINLHGGEEALVAHEGGVGRADVAGGAVAGHTESEDPTGALGAEHEEEIDAEKLGVGKHAESADEVGTVAEKRVERLDEQGADVAEGAENARVEGNTTRDLQVNEGERALSAVVLFHNEYETLNHTLKTWEENGLYRYVSEMLFFLNGVSSEGKFRDKLPTLEKKPWQGMIKIFTSEENLKLGLAITKMVELANEENVLLLEKDWALVEPSSEVETTLGAAKRLLREGEANVVRFRHRDRPGAPLHARIMHEGREEQMLQQQKNLYCYLHHWVKDLPATYPEYFFRCSNRTEDAVTWCSKAKYCQWTNNPAMFRRQWFLDELGRKYRQMYERTIKQDPSSAMLDFEFYTNWQHGVWNDRDFVVALPNGLFEHQEVGEQNLMNTVWYAWNRLHTDAEEKKRALLASEVADCLKPDKRMDSGKRWTDKYPIDFVRMYHYDRAMTRTIEEAVEELGAEALASREALEEGHGTWRHGITALTNLWHKTSLFKYPEEPEEMDITFVTALHSADGEPSDTDLNEFAMNLGVVSDYRVVVFCSDKTRSRLKAILTEELEWEEDMLGNLYFIAQATNNALEKLLGKDNVERVEKLQVSQTWQEKANERGGSVPSAMELKLDMAKPYMVQRAMNDAGGTHFVWLDGLSPCLAAMRASNVTLSVINDSVLRAHLLLGAMTTGVRARNRNEIEAALGASGFLTDMLLEQMQVKADDFGGFGIAIMDFQVFGGSRSAVTLMVGYYDLVLRDMLRNDALGTGREALSIAHKNVDYNFEFFDSRDSCRQGDRCAAAALDKDYARNGTRGCALFRWASGCVSDRR